MNRILSAPYYRLIRPKLANYLLKKGVLYWSVDNLLSEFEKDFLSSKTTIREKVWAWRRGFFSTRIKMYGLNNDNCKQYMPEWIYYRIKPNGEYGGPRQRYDNKLLMREALEKHKQYVPGYYFQVINGKISKLADCPAGIKPTVEGVISLLKTEENIAVKQIGGSRGVGFKKLTHKNKQHYINNQKATKKEIEALLNKLNRHILTEYITNHKDLSTGENTALSAVRVIGVNDKEGGPHITGAIARFSTSSSGVVDNASAGGVFCAVDIEKGEYYNAKTIKNSVVYDVYKHPDTNKKIGGTLPNWGEVKSGLIAIMKDNPDIVWYGFDVAITEKGFKILEINMHQRLASTQVHIPIMKNKYNRRMFFEHMSDKQKRYFDEG